MNPVNMTNASFAAFSSRHFAAKAGMDVLAVSCARELAPFGVETSILIL